MKFYQEWTAARYVENGEKQPSFKAQVPGNVQWDYAKEFGFTDFAYGTGVKKFLEIEDWQWQYETVLNFTANKGERVFFVAEGIDYEFDILLDNEHIFYQEGMYTKVELDITEKVKRDSVLNVRIHTRPWREGKIFQDRQAADQCCKPPVSYGWDWNPRLIASGIWQPAYIETRGENYINACEPFYDLSDDLKSAEVYFETECEGEVEYTLYSPDGDIVYSGKDSKFTVDNVKLWWCNGQGEPNLYKWTAKSSDDEKCGYIGFKTVELVFNEGAANDPDFPKTSDKCAITLKLNGRKIFAKGSNWVNPDVFFGRITYETYEKLVTMAKDANMNIFRCWGGAGINKPAFYELCDKHGIMVWQEFMLACNNYRGTKKYLAILEKEATSILKQLRSHACIAIWCGGNELLNSWSGMDMQSHALRLLNKLCYEYDFKKPFMMTSPMHGMGHGGYLFKTDKDVFANMVASDKTAHTEFGVPSITNAEDLKNIIPENELFPIRKTEAWVLHHGFSAWGEERWVCNDILDYYFGEDKTLEDRVAHSHWLQTQGYKAVFEESRRKWPACSMAINWCYNEPWLTAAGNSLINYPIKAKPAYYAVKDSLRNVMPSARIFKFDYVGKENFTAEIWYLNDSTEDVSDTVDVSIELGDYKKHLLTFETGTVKAGTNLLGPAVNTVLPLDASSNQLRLILKSKNGYNSEYILLFKDGQEKVKTFELNQ